MDDISDLLDEAIAHQTPAPSLPTNALGAGRRALRRRRVAAAATGACAVVLIAGAAWGMADGGGRTETQLATDPTTTTTPRAAETTSEPLQTVAPPPGFTMPPAPDPDMVYPTGPGEYGDVHVGRVRDDVEWAIMFGNVVQLGEGVRVVDHVVNPLGFTLPETSLALELEKDGRRDWAMLTSSLEGGAGEDHVDPTTKDTSFRAWVADAVAANAAATRKVPVITMSGTIVPADGVRVLDAVRHPREAQPYGPVDEAIAVHVRLGSGEEAFVLSLDSTHRVAVEATSVVMADELPEPTMEAFLAHLAERDGRPL